MRHLGSRPWRSLGVWWARSKPIEAYLGSTLLGVRSEDGASWIEAADAEAALQHLASTREARLGAGRRIRVWLSAGLSRAFIVSADCGARDDSEMLAIAQTMAAAATGLSGALTVWTDLWRGQRDCLAVAMATSTLTRLREVCGAKCLRLVSVKPWWNLAVNTALRETPAKGATEVLWSLSEPDGMTLGTLKEGAITSIDSLEPRS